MVSRRFLVQSALQSPHVACITRRAPSIACRRNPKAQSHMCRQRPKWCGALGRREEVRLSASMPHTDYGHVPDEVFGQETRAPYHSSFHFCRPTGVCVCGQSLTQSNTGERTGAHPESMGAAAAQGACCTCGLQAAWHCSTWTPCCEITPP